MKLSSTATFLLAAYGVHADTCSNKEFDQCGGQGFSGETCCPAVIDKCVYLNPYYSQCQPVDLCLNPEFGQCGGTDQEGHPWTKAYHHQTCCPPSFSCFYSSQYYSQCLFNSTNTTCAGKYQQCGGKDADGLPWGSKSGEQTCCIPGYSCNKTNDYYSQCDPLPICSNARYGQCGGVDDDNKPWLEHHSGCCPPDFSCQYVNPYFSQCLWNKSSVQYASHKAAGKLTISGALPTSDADFLWSIAHSVGKKSLSASAQQLAAASS